MVRLQSPSSINTFKQCPRKYYYSYIEKLPRTSNIHCVRGNIVHEVLENFFNIDLQNVQKENFIPILSTHLKNLFNDTWDKYSNQLKKLSLDNEKLQFYYQDSIMMLANWLNTQIQEIVKLTNELTLSDAFNKIKPTLAENYFKSDKYSVRGYIDAIHINDNHIKILDYKTSKSPDFKPSYELQLGIYALMYEEKFGKFPTEVGLWLLKHKEITIPVTEKLIKNAQFEIEQIHLNTETKDIQDYPRNPSPLCKYSTGQCEFYDVCYGLKTVEEFIAKNKK